MTRTPYTHLPILAIMMSAGSAMAQWNPANNGIPDLSQGAAVLGGTTTHLFAKAGTGMYRSTDNGEGWSAIQPPIALNPTESGIQSNDRYIAGSNAATACIHFTDDDGDTWTEAAGAPTATVVRGFMAYAGGFFAYTSNAGIHVSLDEGETWQASNTGLTNLNVIGMASAGPFIVAATVGGGVFRSPGGGNWTASTGIGGSDLNGENIWSMDGSLYYSAQGGALYRSTDLGANWTTWTPPLEFGLGPLEVKRYEDRLYIETRHFAGGGLRDSLFVSEDEGDSWTNITGNLNASDLNASGIYEAQGCVFVGYNLISPGQGIYRRCGSSSIGERSLQAIGLFPNPSEGLVTVDPPQQAVGLPYRVLDLTGTEVLQGRVGGARLQLDLSALAAGTYLLQVDGAGTAPVKVVKR